MSARRGTLAVVCVATAMLMLDIAVVNTAMAHIASDLHAGLGGVQWIIDAYTLALASVVLTSGSVADRLGRRRVFAWGMALFTAASLACGLAGSIAVLDAARAVQGIGGAILFATSLALLADAFPSAQERAGALGVYGATIGASFAIGPAVGGALTSGLGWRWVFFVNVPLGILALLGTRAWVRESRDPAARGLDWGGQATLTAGLFLLVLGLLRGNEQGWGSAPIVAELAGAAALLVAFVVLQRRGREPMLPLSLFRRPAFTGAQVAAFAISASFFSLFIYMTLYLQEILGLSPLEAGLTYLPGTAVMFVISGASAQVVDRVGAGLMIVTGLVLAAIGLVLMTNAQADSSWTVALPATLIACIGTGLLNPALAGVALSSAPPEQSGLAAGVNDTFRQAGIAVGVAAFGALMPASAALGHGSPADYVTSLHHALLIGAGLAVVGAIAVAKLVGVGRPAGVAAPRPAIEAA